jgi:poly-gamma-glutamate capsule biosynthesis protein CapA/YwtB (metallophosphatase superfamily)
MMPPQFANACIRLRSAWISRPVRSAAIFLGMLFLAFVFIWHTRAGSQKLSPSPSYPQEISRVTFAAAGDVIPHEPVVKSALAAQTQAATNTPAVTSETASDSPHPAQPALSEHTGWDALFADVADIFRHADFGFVNLETPVAPEHSLGSKPFQFDAPVTLLDSLKFSGINIVSFANNHVLDQGYAGFDETLNHLHEHGLLFVGSGPTADDSWKPVILEKNGIKIGWLGMTRWLNGRRNPEKDNEPHVAFFPYPGESSAAPGRDEMGVLDAVRAARAQCDLLLISIHWGIEYAPGPRPADVDIAHKMLDAGAGAIVGAHPHVLQTIETYLTQDHRHGVIFYSLGNFLSNQSANYVQGLMPDRAAEPRDSMIVKFSVIKKDYGPAGTRVELGDVGILPVWTENNRLQVKEGQATIPFIHPVLIDREIPLLQARLDQLNQVDSSLSNEQKQEFIQVASQLDLLKHQRELLLGRTGDEYLIAPPAR